MKYCYLNGKIIETVKASISPYDVGFLRGFGVFDVMKTFNGKPFLINEHVARFFRSAGEINLKLPITQNKMAEIIHDLLRKNGVNKSGDEDVIIRSVLSGGVASDGFTYNPDSPTLIILIEKFYPLGENIFKKGAEIITLDFQRHFPGAKITDYKAALKMQETKNKLKAFEIVYSPKGKILEGTTSNIFAFIKGKLVTPKEDILVGSTRNLVIQLSKPFFSVEEGAISYKQLLGADEVFLTATNKDIVPIIKVDDKKINGGKVGKNTRLLMKEFKKYTDNF